MASNLTNQEYYDMAGVVNEISQRNQKLSLDSEAARVYADRYPQRVHVLIFLVCHIARHILKNTLLITNQARTQAHARLIERRTARSEIFERRRTAQALAITLGPSRAISERGGAWVVDDKASQPVLPAFPQLPSNCKSNV